MGLLDEILKQLEEAQNEGRPRPQSQQNRAPERESDEDGAEWEEDEAARPSHAPHIPVRRAPVPVAVVPEPVPARTTVDSRPGFALREQTLPATRIRALLSNPVALRDALIAREILGPPPGLKRLRKR